MGLFAERLSQKLFIQLNDRRVFVRFAQRHVFVSLIQGLHPLLAYLICGRDGLSASADATPRTGHDFDEMVVALSVADAVDDFLNLVEVLFGLGFVDGDGLLLSGGLDFFPDFLGGRDGKKVACLLIEFEI